MKTEYEIYEIIYRGHTDEDVQKDWQEISVENTSHAAFARVFQMRVMKPLRDLRIDRVISDEKGEISRERVK